MAIKPELESWLKGLPLSDTVKAALVGDLEKEDVGSKVLETVMLRSDYSRQSDKAKADVEAAKAEAARQAEAARTSYDQFRVTEEAKVQKFYADNNAKLIQEQQKRQAYEAKLAGLVQEGLISQEEAMVAQQNFVPSAPVAPATPDRKYVTEEKLAETVGLNQTQYVHAIAKINDIADAHFDLFGTRLNRAELVQATLDAGGKKKVEEVWAEKYGVLAKQAELQSLNEAARIKAAVDEALVRDRSERAIAGDNAPFSGLDDGGNKHILSIFSNKDGSHKAMGVSPGVARATEAWRQGKLGKEGGESKSA